jgi:hypothetical protein
LVNAHYRQDYYIWKLSLDANKRATDYLVDHLRDPLDTVNFIEAPVCIPFIPTVRAAELRWWNGYIKTHITASMTSYYLEVTTNTLLTKEL